MHSRILYFGGNPDEPTWKPWEGIVWTERMFWHYIWTVWVNEHPVPTEPSDLSNFNVQRLWPEYEAYIAAHGRTPQRGTTLEETWLGSQLILGKPVDCLLSSSQPAQPVSRITRLRRLSP